MYIRKSSKFIKNYKERISSNENLVLEFVEALYLFIHDRENTTLRDHSLQDKMAHLRSFSVNNYVRVIYSEHEDYFLFHDIGTHDQVYY